jgi:hypothetical protein
MKTVLLLITIIFIGCSTSKPVVTPPVVDSTKKPVYIMTQDNKFLMSEKNQKIITEKNK